MAIAEKSEAVNPIYNIYIHLLYVYTNICRLQTRHTQALDQKFMPRFAPVGQRPVDHTARWSFGQAMGTSSHKLGVPSGYVKIAIGNGHL